MDIQLNNIKYQFNEYGWCHNPIIAFELFKEDSVKKCTILICQRYGKWFVGIEHFNCGGSVFANKRRVELGEFYLTEVQATLAGVLQIKKYVVGYGDKIPYSATATQWSTLKKELQKFEQSILRPTLF